MNEDANALEDYLQDIAFDSLAQNVEVPARMVRNSQGWYETQCDMYVWYTTDDDDPAAMYFTKGDRTYRVRVAVEVEEVNPYEAE